MLIIEDDPLQADVVRLLLEHNGFEIVLAADGAEGLRKLYEVQPDLVILDLILPQMDGWAVCRRIREMSTVPIIIMTASDKCTAAASRAPSEAPLGWW